MTLESIIRARQRQRYADAIALQGFSFTDLRTPPRDLPRGDRPLGITYPPGPIDDADRMHRLPPIELFGEGCHPNTAAVLAGKMTLHEAMGIWWRGWPEE